MRVPSLPVEDRRPIYVVSDCEHSWVNSVRNLVRPLMPIPSRWLDWPSLYVQQAPAGSVVAFLHWSQRVPEWFTDSRICINFHCTDLPFGRGGHPIENMILRGVHSTCMTAHRMTGGLDDGNIIAKRPGIDISSGSRMEILDRFVAPVSDIFVDILGDLDLTGQPQVGVPVEFRRLTQHELKQLWSLRSVRKI